MARVQENCRGGTRTITPPSDIGRAILPALERFPRQEFWQAPYGIIWYVVNWPIGKLSVGNPNLYMVWTIIFTIPIQKYLGWTQSFAFIILFTAIYLFHLIKAPWNVSILWLCLLGLVHPFLLAVPILAKFPVGNPAPFRKTWSHALHAMPYRMSWFYYLTIGIVWLAVAFHI